MASAPFVPRKRLHHDVPGWVQQGARHSVSINVSNRADKPLLVPEIARALMQGFVDYERMQRWYVWVAMVMPDHVHFVATFDLRQGLKKCVHSWKRYHARTLSIDWQSDFFEHRLRNDELFLAECHYVRMNPVREELCAVPEEWPYFLDRERIEAVLAGEQNGQVADKKRWVGPSL